MNFSKSSIVKIKILRTFIKDVKKIKNKTLLKKVAEAVINIKTAETIKAVKDIKKLKGYETAYRIKIGDYRIGLFLENDEILLSRFIKREDIYKKFP